MKITQKILKKYSRGKCTNAENVEVELWLLSKEDDTMFTEIDFGNSIENIKQKLRTSLFKKKPYLHIQKLRYAAVAAILFVIGISSYSVINSSFLLYKKQAVVFKTIKSPKGNHKQMILLDRSIESLSNQSYFETIRNPEDLFIAHPKNKKNEVSITSLDIKVFPNTTQKDIVVTGETVNFKEILKEISCLLTLFFTKFYFFTI